MLDFLMVLPTFNEADNIGGMLESTSNELKKMFKNYRIVVVDESSVDNTVSIVKSLRKRLKNVDLISGRVPKSRGLDVRYAMSRYDSRMYFYMDTDLKDSVPCIKDAVRYCRDGYNLVIGSKYAKGAVLRRPEIRNIMSKPYNLIIRLLFSDGVLDHQGGFKLMDRKAFSMMRRKSIERHWLWDTEVILLARYNNMRIKEMPMKVIDRRARPASILWIFINSCIFAVGIAGFFYRFRIKKDY